MVDESDLERLFDRAFPARSDGLRQAAVWSRIDAALRARRTRRVRPSGWLAAAAVILAVASALFLAQPWRTGEPAPAYLYIVEEIGRADEPMRSWLRQHRPRLLRLNEPGISALDRAIAETGDLLEENPADAELSSRFVMYVNWRADLLAGLAYESG